MAEINSLNSTDSNNTSRFNGSNNVSSLDNAGQALEGMLGRNFKDNDGSNTTTGSNTAYTLQLNRTGITDHADVGRICCRFHTANDGACTITVNSLASKSLKKSGNAELVTGDILENDLKDLCWNPAWAAWQVLGI
jgi:hypothetical protein